jgi:putative peptide maturation system protein
VRVNGQLQTLANVAGWLEWALWRDAAISQRLVDHCLVQQEVQARGLTATESELESGLDEFRSRRGLYTAAEYEEWLRTSGLSHTDVLALAGFEVCRRKLLDLVASDRAPSYFAEHARAFDRVTGIRCGPLAKQEAVELAASVRRGSASILREAAKRANGQRSRVGFVCFRRGEVPADLAGALFDARPGEIVGPFGNGDECDLIEIEEHIPANFEDVRPNIVKVIFDQWLLEKRRKAQVEWYWGRARDPREV